MANSEDLAGEIPDAYTKSHTVFAGSVGDDPSSIKSGRRLDDCYCVRIKFGPAGAYFKTPSLDGRPDPRGQPVGCDARIPAACPRPKGSRSQP